MYIRNERDGSVYNYFLFHVTMCLANMYTTMQLTQWFQPQVTFFWLRVLIFKKNLLEGKKVSHKTKLFSGEQLVESGFFVA